MCPFWVVRRLTRQQLDKERNATRTGEWLPRFTCTIVNQAVSDVCVYTPIHMESRKRNVSLPFITIVGDLELGEELILEVAPLVKKTRKEHGATLCRKKNDRTGKTRKNSRSRLMNPIEWCCTAVAAFLLHNIISAVAISSVVGMQLQFSAVAGLVNHILWGTFSFPQSRVRSTIAATVAG